MSMICHAIHHMLLENIQKTELVLSLTHYCVKAKSGNTLPIRWLTFRGYHENIHVSVVFNSPYC